MAKAIDGPKRIFVIPDVQAKPGVPLDQCDWIGKAIAEYRPDTVVCIGDLFDMASLNSHEQPGSAPMEGQRYKSDLEAGHEALDRIDRHIRKLKASWKPRKVFCFGNHEIRAETAALHDPKYLGHIGIQDMDTLDWERHGFLERVWLSGIVFSHYFQSSHSNRPIGGEVSNRLTKIGASFVAGHEQGIRYGNRIMACGKTLHGLVAGSAYLHREEYRGAQQQRHWTGCVVLNDVQPDGDYDVMPLSLRFLCRKYEHAQLTDYMATHYPWGDWRHLGSEGLNGAADLSGDTVQQASGGARVRPSASVPGRGKPAKKGNARIQPHRAHASGGRARRA